MIHVLFYFYENIAALPTILNEGEKINFQTPIDLTLHTKYPLYVAEFFLNQPVALVLNLWFSRRISSSTACIQIR